MKIIQTLVIGLVFLPVLPSTAQIPSVPGLPKTPGIPSVPGLPTTPGFPSTPSLPRELNPNQPQNNNQNTGEIPNDPTQLRNWVCAMGKDRIAVSAKEVKGWKELIEKQAWKCSEGNTDIPDKTLNLSCEPEQTLGILTVYWLGGKNGKKQLTAWKTDLASKHGMVCTLNNVQLFDSSSDIIPNLNR